MTAPRLRSRVTYANVTATLALALALSTGGAYAAAQIGAGDIKDDAVRTRHITDGHVTKSDIKDGAVTRAKLAPTARSKVVDYQLGPHTFAPGNSASRCVNLSTQLTRAQVVGSVWSAQLERPHVPIPGVVDKRMFTVPGHGESGSSAYQVYVTTGDDQYVLACVVLVSGPGEDYDNVRIIRIPKTEQWTPPPGT